MAYLPLLVLAPAAPAAVIIALAGPAVVGLSRVDPVVHAARSRMMTVGGKVVIAAVTLIALPGFLSAIIEIAGEV